MTELNTTRSHHISTLSEDNRAVQTQGHCGRSLGLCVVARELLGNSGADRGGGAVLEEEEGSTSVCGWVPVSVLL